MLRALYFVVIVVCIIPTIPGVAGVVASSLSYIPPLGLMEPSLNGFSQVFQWEGAWHSIGLSLCSAIASSYIACFLTFCILQASWGNQILEKDRTDPFTYVGYSPCGFRHWLCFSI